MVIRLASDDPANPARFVRAHPTLLGLGSVLIDACAWLGARVAGWLDGTATALNSVSRLGRRTRQLV